MLCEEPSGLYSICSTGAFKVISYKCQRCILLFQFKKGPVDSFKGSFIIPLIQIHPLRRGCPAACNPRKSREHLIDDLVFRTVQMFLNKLIGRVHHKLTPLLPLFFQAFVGDKDRKSTVAINSLPVVYLTVLVAS